MLKQRKYLSLKTLLLTTFLSVGLIAVSYNKQTVAQVANDLFAEDSSRVAGISSLMTAVYSNDIEGVKFFSKGGAAAINQQNIGGATALHIAAREGNFEAANILIEGGANLNISDNEGWTPLMRAASVGSSEIIELLLQKNADLNSQNSQNETALVVAANSNCTKCLELIAQKYNLEKLANPRTLSDQIDQAFVIIKNHSNEESLKVISDFKDKLVKAVPVKEVVNLPVEEIDAYEVVTPPSSSDKSKSLKFKLVDAAKVHDPETANKGQKFKIVSVEQEPVVSIEEVQKPSVTEANKPLVKKFRLLKGQESLSPEQQKSDGSLRSEVAKKFVTKRLAEQKDEVSQDEISQSAVEDNVQKSAGEGVLVKKKKFKFLSEQNAVNAVEAEPSKAQIDNKSVENVEKPAAEKVEKSEQEVVTPKSFKDLENGGVDVSEAAKPKKKFSFKSSQ